MLSAMLQWVRQLFAVGMSPNPLARPPGLDGDPGLGIPGVSGIPRASMLGTVVSAEAPGIPGDTVRFVVLPDGTLIAPASVPDGVLFPIADAVEATVETPYEVEANRISGDTWGASATEVETLDVKPGSPGQELTYSRVDGVESATVDGRDERLPPDFRTLLAGDDDLWVEARRADDTTWVVHRSLL